MNSLTSKIDIDNIEAKMLSLPQANCGVIHKFQPGYYIREVTIPTGTLAIGHHQNFPHLNIFVKGKVLMLNDDGTQNVIEAPMTFVGQPGRKIGYVLEEMVWQNIYPTEQTEVELLEAFYLTKSDYSREFSAHKYAAAYITHNEDRDDYVSTISELGYTQDQVDIEVNNEADQIGMPIGDYKCMLAISPIDGTGVFATSYILAGEEIGPSKVGHFRTPLGRYVNHSKNPNAEMIKKGDNIFLVATQDIVGALGGQPGQEIVIDYRAARTLSIGA